MPSFIEAVRSQVGRKILTGITGLLLLLYIITHVSANLTIFLGPETLNRYSLFLHSFGWLLWVARIGLLLAFVFHIWIGLSIWLKRRRVRPDSYNVYSSKGGSSKQGMSSRSMALTGIIILIFLIIHIKTFALGDAGMIVIDGHETRDLRSLVIDTFQKPVYAFGYTFVMVLLGTHLGHGIWSAFVSLTMKSRKLSGVIYVLGVILAVLIAAGFLFIPLYIYFTGGEGILITG